MNWSRRFDDPIKTPDGKIIKTLREAKAALSTVDEGLPRDRAADVLEKAAEHGGPFLFIARIAVAKALLGPDETRWPTKAEQFKLKRAEYLKRKKGPTP